MVTLVLGNGDGRSHTSGSRSGRRRGRWCFGRSVAVTVSRGASTGVVLRRRSLALFTAPTPEQPPPARLVLGPLVVGGRARGGVLGRHLVLRWARALAWTVAPPALDSTRSSRPPSLRVQRMPFAGRGAAFLLGADFFFATGRLAAGFAVPFGPRFAAVAFGAAPFAAALGAGASVSPDVSTAGSGSSDGSADSSTRGRSRFGSAGFGFAFVVVPITGRSRFAGGSGAGASVAARRGRAVRGRPIAATGGRSRPSGRRSAGAAGGPRTSTIATRGRR